MKMEAVCSSETLMNLHKMAWHHISAESTLPFFMFLQEVNFYTKALLAKTPSWRITSSLLSMSAYSAYVRVQIFPHTPASHENPLLPMAIA
jgi:hypothetical protein